MRTLNARYPGRCSLTGRAFPVGALITMLGKGRYALVDTPEPADPDLAQSDPDAAAHAGRYLRQAMQRGVSDIWRTSTGKEYYRNRRGLCEDAPCCGCCNA